LRTLIKLLGDTRALATIEYGLIAMLIAVGLIVVIGLFGDHLNGTYQDLNQQLRSHL
jgi:Flp pilus assembly pilin Flp